MFFTTTKIRKSGVLSGMTDCHSHLLWGVDDGFQTKEDTLAALQLLEEAGVKEVWCTPHVMEEVPNTTQRLKERFAQLQEAYQGHMVLHLASEYMLDGVFQGRLEAKDLLRHEGEYVLVETSYYSPPMNMKEILESILHQGMRPLLAHPERYRYMDEDNYRELKDMGVDLQLNLPSLCGLYGKDVERKALWILKEGMYNMIGMDLHSLKSLRFLLDCKINKKVAKLVQEIKG